jgi:glycosyltransferase involved in cell wall biosynthesis
MRRDSVLYITPIMPQPFGNGLGMRAASVLEALARRFDVHLFVVPAGGNLTLPSVLLRRNTVRIGRLDVADNLDPLFGLISRILDPAARARAEIAYPKPFLSRFCTGESASCLLGWMTGFPVSAVHVMRLYLAPMALPFLRQPQTGRPFCVLDLDDDDAQTCRRIMNRHSDLGDSRAAAVAAAEAEKYQALADLYLRAFDRVLVCSEPDVIRTSTRFPGVRLAVVPNAYRPLDFVPRHRPSECGPLRLLFVATFGYFPNADAAMFLCDEVLPTLRRLTDREIRIELVGAGGTTVLAELARHPEVKLHGFVKDLGPLYARSDVAVVPLRAGGGTRIKILEAFVHGVPVVTTTLGVEGIDVVDGEHVLLADAAEPFARACLSMKQRPELAARLTERASALVLARYSPTAVDAAIAGVYDL